jgi:hypothetical protein
MRYRLSALPRNVPLVFEPFPKATAEALPPQWPLQPRVIQASVDSTLLATHLPFF